MEGTKPKATEFEHRVRVEQRITSLEVSHRFRYNFAGCRAFSRFEIKTRNAYMIGDLETLLTVVKTSKTEYEQRFAAGVGFVLSDFVILKVKFYGKLLFLDHRSF